MITRLPRTLFRQLATQIARPLSSAPKASLSCPACKSTQLQIKEDVFCCKSCPNRQGIDFFVLLGLPHTYRVDLKTAEENYRDLQRSAHPDKVGLDDANSVPEGFSSLLNKAISVIKSPTERAMHLLFLLDGCSISESKLTNDPELLMEMMEINEEIEECGTDKVCLEKQNDLNKDRLAICDKQLQELFPNHQYLEARKVCEKMHYLERIKDTLIKKLNSL
jgi:Fe-S protein assembly co-chaperone HscB